MKSILLFLSCLIFIVFYSCNSTSSQSDKKTKNDSVIKKDSISSEEILLKNIHFTDTVILVKDRSYDVRTIVKIPSKIKPKGTIVVLHGWNLPATDWCTKTELCKKALEKGYILILPDVGKSMYCYEIFPETRRDWIKYPTRRWIQDTLFKFIQNKFQLLLPSQCNYIIGLSTGGRGVAVLAVDNPTIFKGVASLSGDFDMTVQPDEAICNGFYGPIDKFPERWKGKDNLVSRIKEYKTPTYLGHSKADKVCPYRHTVAFYDALKKFQPDLRVEFHSVDNFQHDYVYWNSEVDNMLKFFESLENK